MSPLPLPPNIMVMPQATITNLWWFMRTMSVLLLLLSVDLAVLRLPFCIQVPAVFGRSEVADLWF